jgi:hypothetical protein
MPKLPQQPAQGGIEGANFPRPPIAPGSAAETAARNSEAVENMATELGTRINEVRRATDFNLGEAKCREQADDLSYNILRDPKVRADPDAARAALTDPLKPLQDQMRQKYPMADWDGGLTRNMDIWGSSRVKVIGYHAIENRSQDAKDRLDLGAAAAIHSALTSADPKDSQVAVTNYL